jgi:hypothetical protein
MADDERLLFRARRAVQRYHPIFLADANVHAVGVGHKSVGGESTGEVCVTIFVGRKFPRSAFVVGGLLPRLLDLDGETIATDVVVGGPFFPSANTARIRPPQPGTSIGALSVTAGTFGGVVIDDVTGSQLILSNNHVLANSNQEPVGAQIVQPGPLDGGTSPADVVATLLRFVPIAGGAAMNYVDAAVAVPTSESLISNVPLNGVPAPSPLVRAVGLYFADDRATHSNLNPIAFVLTMIGANFSDPSSVMQPSIGQSLQKTGRTTEKTVGTVETINTIVPVIYGGTIGTATFYNQIVTTLMGMGGDSGSIVLDNS